MHKTFGYPAATVDSLQTAEILEVQQYMRAAAEAENSHRAGATASRGTSGGSFGKVDPKEAYQKIREKMLELEIEKDEQ